MTRTFETKSISFSPKIWKLIDRKRKDTPRSRFICRLLEEALGVPEKERTQYE